MIQINLLPDIKLEYIKAKRTKRIVVLSAIAVGGVCLAVMILLFVTVNVFQRAHLNDLNSDITRLTEQLEGTENLDKILTVQNQLNNLSSLHDSKPVATRIFDFIQKVTPAKINIAKLDVAFDKSTVTFSGSSDSLSTVNTFVDTLKFAQYRNVSDNASATAFSSVVLSSFARDEKGATYSVTMSYDPLIFDGKLTIEPVVTQGITTRSEVEKPEALFQPLTNTIGGQ